MGYPVSVDVTSPRQFDRSLLALRLVLAIVLGWVGITAGWLVCLLYGGLPVIAAIALSSGSAQLSTVVASRMWKVLVWLLQLSAFMSFLVDRFPTGDARDVEITLRPSGQPTVGSALLRLLTSIPSGLVLTVLWLVSGVLWIASAVIVLVGWHMPRSILAFQRGVLRWQARLVAYHASLVDEYPPFAFDTDDHHHTTLRASEAP